MAKVADTRQFNRGGAAFVEQKFVYELPDDVGISDVLRPEYWRPVSDKITRLAIVTCIGGADNIDVDLRCMGVAQGYCVMRLIRTTPELLFDDDLAISQSRRVEYRPGLKWCVVDKDNSIMESGFASRDDALIALESKGAA